MRSSIPPLNVCPMFAPSSAVNQKLKAASEACIPQNNSGDTKRKVNSKGSVIPVRNEVRAAEPTVIAVSLRVSLGAATTIAAAAAGIPKIMNGYLPS